MTGKDQIVRFRNLFAGFVRRGKLNLILKNAELSIERGDLVCLVGPSGSGKSVLLNLLIGALKSDTSRLLIRGSIQVMGEEIVKKFPESLTRRMGIVFQESALFEDLSTRENVAFGLRGQAMKKDAAAKRIDKLLEEVDLADPPARVHELSGGQKKRLALARALARSPEFLIFDEPTTGLDPQLCAQIAGLIKRTHEAGNGQRTTLVVTHDYEAMLPIATKIFLLNPVSGEIEILNPGESPAGRLEEIAAIEPRKDIKTARAPFSYYLKRMVIAPKRWITPIAGFLTHPIPSSGRQTLTRFADALIHPALYVCAAGAVLGGLATFFALENNPLKGAMDRQALIGVGKVLTAIVVPLMTAILFAARMGAGAAARLGNIRLGRKDDALRMMGCNPFAYLVTPLFWACLIGLPLLALPVCISSALSSMGFACATRPITVYKWATAFSQNLDKLDLIFAIIKLAGSGVLVAAAAAFFGLKTKTSAEDLGRDVTSSIVAATFLVILWHGLLTFIQYS